MEDSLEKFSGDDLPNVTQFIRDFEEMAEVCGWSDIHMVVFARKLLTGSAQAFVRQEQCMKSWAKFKKALVDEFEDIVGDRQVHQELAHRTQRADESLLQYMYSMREIAGQGTVDTQSVIDYIIQGIPDGVTNKTILYGAWNMQQLKGRFKQYEAMKRDMKAKTKFDERKDDKAERSAMRSQSRQTSSDPKRCFNCGGDDHISVQCSEKEKGVRCFSCNEFGHVAAKCTLRPKETYVIPKPEKKEYVKEVSIDDCKSISLEDRCSELTFIRSDEYARLGSPPLGNCKLRFDGLGSADIETSGEFTKVMIADWQADDHEDASDVFRINVIEQTDEMDLAHVEESHHREAIRDIVRGYKPEKKQDVGITANIVSKSDKPIVRRPRILAPSEKREIDDLVKLRKNESDFKCQVCHRPGKNMEYADTPSRNPLPGAMYEVECEDGQIVRLRSAQNKGLEVRKILDAATCSQADGYVIRRLIDEEWGVNFEKQRRELREDAKRKIAATQEENRKNFNKRRKSAKQYLRGDLVAIKKTQFKTQV